LSDAVGKGPQFLKNFLDGGTFWNEYTDTTGVYSLEDSASQVQQVSSVITETVLSAPDGGANAKYPNYFSNFYNDGEECRLGAITCCYTASRSPGTTLAGNSDMCAHDMYLSAQSNHIHKKSYTIYDPQGTNNAYCSGFAWDEGSFADDVKYNTLYKMAIGENLFEHDRVRNIPGAPMCGCAEQMPIITNAACTKVIEGYMLNLDGSITANMSWEDCGMNLLDYYKSLPGRQYTEGFFMEARLVGEGKCPKAMESFMNDRMLIHH
jgi:hypothetical protein